MQQHKHCHKPGNLVWENTSPALLLPNNKLSYFNLKPRNPITPTTPLLPFTSPATLRAVIPSIPAPSLRNFALGLWARSVVIDSLTCKCVVRGWVGSGVVADQGGWFGVGGVREVVGVLRGLAVGNWFEEGKVVEVVTVAAVVKAIRRFWVKRQKRVYKLEKKETCHFTQSSSDLQAVKEYPETSNVEDNFEFSDRLDQQSTASVILREPLQPLHNDHLPTFSKTGIKLGNEQSIQNLLAYLRIIASNPFASEEEEVKDLNIVKSSFLTFRNLLYGNIPGLCSSNCSHGNRETHFSCSEVHGITTPTQVGENEIKRSGSGKISSSIVPSLKSLVSSKLKRKFDKVKYFGSCPKLRKTVSSSSCKGVDSELENAPVIKNGHAGSLKNYVSQSLQKGQQLLMQPINDNDATSNHSNEQTTDNASRSNLNENGELNLPIHSQTSVRSQKRMQPEGLSASAYKAKILHMKFPRDFHLPSKEELVKKFRKFGSVDVSKTKVFFYTGSAQVAFLHDNDAAVTYQYAKRKKVLFGQTNVLFWLDPFEYKRKGNEISVYSSSSPVKHPGLKSCLRRSHPLEKGVRKKPYRVRFLMETS